MHDPSTSSTLSRRSLRNALIPSWHQDKWVLLWMLVSLVWIVGQAFRDRTWLTGLFFYLPTTLYFLGMLAALWRERRKGRPRLQVCWLVMAALALWTFAGVDREWRPSLTNRSAKHSLRVIHWNVWYLNLSLEGVRREIQAQRPDLVLLSEVEWRAEMRSIARALGPAYRAYRLGTEAVVARGTVHCGNDLLAGGADAYPLVWTVDGRQWRLLFVDLPSRLDLARHPILTRIVKQVQQGNYDVVAGDFNAPRRSLALTRLPSGYRHAYDEAGGGWSATWPLPLPLWSIDQCMVGPRMDVVRYDLVSTWYSDHRMQVVDLVPREEIP